MHVRHHLEGALQEHLDSQMCCSAISLSSRPSAGLGSQQGLHLVAKPDISGARFCALCISLSKRRFQLPNLCCCGPQTLQPTCQQDAHISQVSIARNLSQHAQSTAAKRVGLQLQSSNYIINYVYTLLLYIMASSIAQSSRWKREFKRCIRLTGAFLTCLAAVERTGKGSLLAAQDDHACDATQCH